MEKLAMINFLAGVIYWLCVGIRFCIIMLAIGSMQINNDSDVEKIVKWVFMEK